MHCDQSNYTSYTGKEKFGKKMISILHVALSPHRHNYPYSDHGDIGDGYDHLMGDVSDELSKEHSNFEVNRDSPHITHVFHGNSLEEFLYWEHIKNRLDSSRAQEILSGVFVLSF
jgi:hypothetical protein